jgi:hypothetical protein
MRPSTSISFALALPFMAPIPSGPSDASQSASPSARRRSFVASLAHSSKAELTIYRVCFLLACPSIASHLPIPQSLNRNDSILSLGYYYGNNTDASLSSSPAPTTSPTALSFRSSSPHSGGSSSPQKKPHKSPSMTFSHANRSVSSLLSKVQSNITKDRSPTSPSFPTSPRSPSFPVHSQRQPSPSTLPVPPLNPTSNGSILGAEEGKILGRRSSGSKGKSGLGGWLKRAGSGRRSEGVHVDQGSQPNAQFPSEEVLAQSGGEDEEDAVEIGWAQKMMLEMDSDRSSSSEVEEEDDIDDEAIEDGEELLRQARDPLRPPRHSRHPSSSNGEPSSLTSSAMVSSVSSDSSFFAPSRSADGHQAEDSPPPSSSTSFFGCNGLPSPFPIDNDETERQSEWSIDKTPQPANDIASFPSTSASHPHPFDDSLYSGRTETGLFPQASTELEREPTLTRLRKDSSTEHARSNRRIQVVENDDPSPPTSPAEPSSTFRPFPSQPQSDSISAPPLASPPHSPRRSKLSFVAPPDASRGSIGELRSEMRRSFDGGRGESGGRRSFSSDIGGRNTGGRSSLDEPPRRRASVVGTEDDVVEGEEEEDDGPRLPREPGVDSPALQAARERARRAKSLHKANSASASTFIQQAVLASSSSSKPISQPLASSPPSSFFSTSNGSSRPILRADVSLVTLESQRGGPESANEADSSATPNTPAIGEGKGVGVRVAGPVVLGMEGSWSNARASLDDESRPRASLERPKRSEMR